MRVARAVEQRGYIGKAGEWDCCFAGEAVAGVDFLHYWACFFLLQELSAGHAGSGFERFEEAPVAASENIERPQCL